MLLWPALEVAVWLLQKTKSCEVRMLVERKAQGCWRCMALVVGMVVSGMARYSSAVAESGVAIDLVLSQAHHCAMD